MKGNIEERACELAAYIIENRATVRDAARRFGISKSTVHMDRGKWNGGTGVSCIRSRSFCVSDAVVCQYVFISDQCYIAEFLCPLYAASGETILGKQIVVYLAVRE